MRVCLLPWHKSQSEVGAEAGFTPAGHVVPHLWLTRPSSQAAGAPLGSAAWEGASEDQLSICESIPFSKHSLRSPWPQPSADASSSLLCPSSAPGPALEGAEIHSSQLQQGSRDKRKHTALRSCLHPGPGLITCLSGKNTRDSPDAERKGFGIRKHEPYPGPSPSYNRDCIECPMPQMLGTPAKCFHCL